MNWKPSNREQVQAGRHFKGRYYCFGCDGALIYQGERCGRKDKHKRKRLKRFRAEE